MLGVSQHVIGGVDTHSDTHTAAAIDDLGRLLGHETFPTNRGGYAALLAWLAGHGEVIAVGVEGTGAYGAGLARHLTTQAIKVVEVDRPNRQQRRKNGKSDPADAEAAARAVLAGTATGTPKTRDGAVEALRTLRATKRTADKAHTAARNSLRHMVITAPAGLREHLEHLTGPALVTACAALRPDRSAMHEPVTATKVSLRRLARRAQHLAAELAEIKADIASLVQHIAPELVEHYGVGPDTASQLLVTAGDNPDRLRSERSFAALCGVSPVKASSGRTDRHRLNRGGDRH
ncbi:MAG: IS110 family transposase, partial [Knoellia sp.]